MTYSYPFLLMNHLAIMQFMIKKNIRFVKQVSELIGMPVRPIPTSMDTDPNTPTVYLYRGPADSVKVDLKTYIK